MAIVRVRGHVASGRWVRESFRVVSGRRELTGNGGSYGIAKSLRVHRSGANFGKVQVIGGRAPDRWYKPTRASRGRIDRLFNAKGAKVAVVRRGY